MLRSGIAGGSIRAARYSPRTVITAHTIHFDLTETLEKTMSNDLQNIIEDAWENRSSLAPETAPAKIGEAVNHVIEELNHGRLRVAEKIGGDWVTHQWIKKAVLLSFRLEENVPMPAGRYGRFY